VTVKVTTAPVSFMNSNRQVRRAGQGQRLVLIRADVTTGALWGAGSRADQPAKGLPLASVQAPASSAGLPGNSAVVRVGPPLSCSGPTLASMGLASVPTRSPFTPVDEAAGCRRLSQVMAERFQWVIPSKKKKFLPSLSATRCSAVGW